MDPVIIILLSFMSLLVTLSIAKWVFRIETIIRYLRGILFLLKVNAEKNNQLSEDQRKWVDDQMK